MAIGRSLDPRITDWNRRAGELSTLDRRLGRTPVPYSTQSSTIAPSTLPIGGLTATAPQPSIPQIAPPTGGGGAVISPPTQEPSQAMTGLQAAAPDTPTADFQQPLGGMLNPRLGQRTLPNAYSGLKVLTY